MANVSVCHWIASGSNSIVLGFASNAMFLVVPSANKATHINVNHVWMLKIVDWTQIMDNAYAIK